MSPMTEAAVPFAVRDRAGYWLVGLADGRPAWGEHADALRFDTLDDAYDAVQQFERDLWALDGARVLPWPVAEGYRAVVEPCTGCCGTGRVAEDNPYHLRQGHTERCCLSCWGYGERAIVGLNTVQLSWGGLLDGQAHDNVIHLVRASLAGGCPGPLLCGIDFRAKDGPGYSVGGGCSGPGWKNAPCPACVAAARESFPGLPVLGSVGGPELADAVGVPNRSTWDFRRTWREESTSVRRQAQARRLVAATSRKEPS